MEKRNTILLTVIAIATLLIAVAGATFAYFASNINTSNGNIDFNAKTSNNKTVFTAESTESISLNVASYMMQQAYAGNGSDTTSSNGDVANELVKTANLSVNLTASDQGKITECTYDVVWVWDNTSSDFSTSVSDATSKVNSQNIYPSKYYVRTEIPGESQYYTPTFKEFTISGSETVSGTEVGKPTSGEFLEEKNLDTITCADGKENLQDCQKLMLKEGETLATSTNANVKYQFTIKFYNLPTDQSSLMDKNFKAHISVENVVC